jgi:hypothetical protein
MKTLFLSLVLLTLVLVVPAFAGEDNCTSCTQKRSGSFTICNCKAGQPEGFCSCSCPCNNSGLCTGGECQDDKALTPERQEKIAQQISTHKVVMTVFISEKCFHGPLGIFYVNEASRQGIAIRFVVPPNNMTPAERDAWNAKMAKQQDIWNLQEQLLETSTLPEASK